MCPLKPSSPGWSSAFCPASSPTFSHSLGCPENEENTGEGEKKGHRNKTCPKHQRPAFPDTFWTRCSCCLKCPFLLLAYEQNSNDTSSVRTSPMANPSLLRLLMTSDIPDITHHTLPCDKLAYSLLLQPQHSLPPKPRTSAG